ncbi:ABC-type transporter Mla subunit MlaD [Bradyrhizobium sp. F1.13.1]
MFDSSKDRVEALADQIRAALAELGETVDEEQEQLQGLIADRPITSLLASAFALGVVAGFMLRRH